MPNLTYTHGGPDELAELLWTLHMACRRARDPELRAMEPEPIWIHRDPETQALWTDFAAKLILLFGPRAFKPFKDT